MSDGRYRRSPFLDAADRLEMVARGAHNRLLAEVQGDYRPAPASTAYARSEETFRPVRIMHDPAQAWAETPAALATSPERLRRNWRHRMPFPVRWVMGWP